MLYLITVIISFFALIWLFKKPHVLEPEVSRYPISYEPIGLRVWTVGVSIISALIPIWNIISVIILIIVLFLLSAMNDVEWHEAFPTKPNRKKSKLAQFLNKTLYD